MHASRGSLLAVVFVFLTLAECTISAPQYFLDSYFYPMPPKGNLMYLTPNEAQEYHDRRGIYPENIYPVNYPDSSPWLVPHYSLDMSLVPPVREESEFKFAGPETGSEGNTLHERGRSDIDPVKDHEESGYSYPKPEIEFDLPNFKPLSNAEAEPQDVTIATTTTEEITEKTTTVSIPETSSVKF